MSSYNFQGKKFKREETESVQNLTSSSQTFNATKIPPISTKVKVKLTNAIFYQTWCTNITYRNFFYLQKFSRLILYEYIPPENLLRMGDHVKNNFLGEKFGKLQEELDLIIGIPTIHRPHEIYIFDTLESLFVDFEKSSLKAGVLILFGGGNLTYFEAMKQIMFDKYSGEA